MARPVATTTDLRSHGGVGCKYTQHPVQVLVTGVTTLREACMPAEAQGELPLAVERGETRSTEADVWRKTRVRDFERALARTRLAEHSDSKAANRFLIRQRREVVNRPSGVNCWVERL